MNVNLEIISGTHYLYKGYDIHLSPACTCSCEGEGTPYIEYWIDGIDLYDRAVTDNLFDLIKVIDELDRIAKLPSGTQLRDDFIIKEKDGHKFINALDIPHKSKSIDIAYFLPKKLDRDLNLADFQLEKNYNNIRLSFEYLYTYCSFNKDEVFTISKNIRDNVMTSIIVSHWKKGILSNTMPVESIADAIILINKLR